MRRAGAARAPRRGRRYPLQRNESAQFVGEVLPPDLHARHAKLPIGLVPPCISPTCVFPAETSASMKPRHVEASGTMSLPKMSASYAEMVEAIKDHKHAPPDEIREWLAEDFDSHVVDIESITMDVAALVKKWLRNSPAIRLPRN